MHNFPRDFYGYEMRALVLGYIRPELDYVSRGTPPAIRDLLACKIDLRFPEGLIEDIEIDRRVALNCLKRPEYEKYARDPHFTL
jgi:riboflavin kinase